MDVVTRYKETREELFEEAGISPLSKFVTTDGPVKRVHYLELGKGAPFVLIHGGLSHASEWIPILKPLAEHFHLYVVDRPGHGLSDPIDYSGVDYRRSAVEFVRSFIDGLGLEQAAVMGNSMGGYFSICFAMEYPERVQSLLLIGAPAGMNRWIPLMLRLLGTKGLNRVLIKTLARPSITGTKNIYKQIIVADVERLSKKFIEHSYYNMLLPGAKTAHLTLLESVLTIRGWKEELYLTDQLSQLRVPVHFIWGDEDAFEKPDTGIEKAARIENHTFEIVKDAGHCPWLDQPEACSSLILQALKG